VDRWRGEWGEGSGGGRGGQRGERKGGGGEKGRGERWRDGKVEDMLLTKAGPSSGGTLDPMTTLNSFWRLATNPEWNGFLFIAGSTVFLGKVAACVFFFFPQIFEKTLFCFTFQL
jgi:hypothetical protein